MARRIISISIILICLIIGALVLSNNNAYAQTSTATPSRTNTSSCSPIIVVTSTPSPTFTPTPRIATATTTPSCHPILVTATPLVSATPGAALPDLSVTQIGEFTYTTASPTPNAQGCWPGGPLTRIGLRVTIHNSGPGNAGSFAVNLNGSVQMVAGLGANQTISVDFFQTLTRTRVATVDSTGLVAETDENNNTMTLNLPGATSTSTGTLPPQMCITKTPTPTGTLATATPGTGPDLVISGIVYVGSTPTCANQLKERVDISNIGTADAGMFFVTINGTQYQINSLAAGQTTSIVVSASQSVTATADSTNLIAESNETNNSFSANFPLPSQAATCTPTITGTPPTPSRTPTITPTRLCVTATPERIMVLPVTSPTSGNTQVINISINNGTSATVISEAGTFMSSTPVPGGGAFAVTINLVPNSTNHLQVRVTVNASNLCAPYTLSTTVDSSGNPLNIVQSSGPTLTPTRTPTPPVDNFCSPVTSTITAPFTWDGAGVYCWQSSNLGSYINNWNNNSVTINGLNITNVYTAASSYPPKIGGFWYVSYNASFAWSHFEAK